MGYSPWGHKTDGHDGATDHSRGREEVRMDFGTKIFVQRSGFEE